jgi:hypothetical protein
LYRTGLARSDISCHLVDQRPSAVRRRCSGDDHPGHRMGLNHLAGLRRQLQELKPEFVLTGC